MIIPHTQLSPDALHGLVEAFITREGTDYGFDEISLEVKTAQVMKLLNDGDVVILYDEATESINIVSRHDIPRD